MNWVLVCLAAVFTLLVPRAHAQERPAVQISLNALAITEAPLPSQARVWIQLKNESSRPYLFCHELVTVSVLRRNALGSGSSGGTSGACQDAGGRDFWILLPGESRFERLGSLTVPDDVTDLWISVELAGREFGSEGALFYHTVRWQRPFAEAVENAERLRVQ